MSDNIKEIEYVPVDPDDDDRADSYTSYYDDPRALSPAALAELKAMMDEEDALRRRSDRVVGKRAE